MEPPKRERLIDSEEEEEEQRIEMEMEMEMEIEMEMKRKRFIENESEFLPPEINTEILSRLPADSAIGCRGISKQWRSLIDHPSFRDTHTRQLISSSPSSSKKFGNYLIPNSSTSSSGFFLCALQDHTKFGLRFLEYNDYYVIDEEEKLVPEFKRSKAITRHPFRFYLEKWGDLLMSSCNGLVFMGSTIPNYVNDIYVCNPFTKEYVNLSLRTTITQVERRRRLKMKGYMTYGFGYLPSTNQYKVVSIYYQNLNGAKGEVSVYTIGSGRWRNKGEIPYWLYNALHPGFFANGAIHWFNNTSLRTIVTFDLANEEFRMVVPSPPLAPSVNHVDKPGVLGGCLCVTRSDKTRCESPKDIWVLNLHTKETGEEEFSWNKRFSIPWKGTTYEAAEPHVILRSGKVLLRGGIGLISYDPKTGAFNEDRQIGFYNDNKLKIIPYTKSFISLKALGEECTKWFGGFVSYALAQHQIVVNSNIKKTNGNWWFCCMCHFF